MELKQPDFKVFADRDPIPVQRVAATFSDDRIEEDGNCYGIAVVDSDDPVSVEIRCERSLSAAKILPENRQRRWNRKQPERCTRRCWRNR